MTCSIWIAERWRREDGMLVEMNTLVIGSGSEGDSEHIKEIRLWAMLDLRRLTYMDHVLRRRGVHGWPHWVIRTGCLADVLVWAGWHKK